MNRRFGAVEAAGHPDQGRGGGGGAAREHAADAQRSVQGGGDTEKRTGDAGERTPPPHALPSRHEIVMKKMPALRPPFLDGSSLSSWKGPRAPCPSRCASP